MDDPQFENLLTSPFILCVQRFFFLVFSDILPIFIPPFPVIRYYFKSQLCDRNYMCTAENIRMKFTLLIKAVPRIYRPLLVVTILNCCPCAYPSQGFCGEGDIGWRNYLQTWFYWCRGPTPFSRGKEGPRADRLKQLWHCCHMQLHIILILLLSSMI